MFASDSNLTCDTCEFLLSIELPSLWEDILLMVGGQMYFQHDGAPPHYTWHMREYLKKSFPNLWLGRGRPLAWPPKLPDLNASWLLSLEPLEIISVWNKGWFPRQHCTMYFFAVAEQYTTIHPTLHQLFSLFMHATKCIATGGGHCEQLLWHKQFNTYKGTKTHSQSLHKYFSNAGHS